MSSPLVTVIVPVYNLAPYLETCIQSLVGQTYTSTELIFVDDGSTDQSREILNAASEKYHNIKVLHQENAGQGFARNNGLDNATGEYVSFVDGDDWIAPDTLEVSVGAALSENADIVCYGFQKVTKVNNEISLLEHFEYDPSLYTNQDYISLFLLDNTLEKNSLNAATCGKLYKRSLLEANKVRFRLRVFEDSPFMLEALYHAQKVTFLKGLYYFYYIRGLNNEQGSTMTSGLSETKVINFYHSDQLMKEFLEAKGLLEKYAASFNRYHNARVLIYGGYYDTYKWKKPPTRETYLLFLKYLQLNSKDLGWHRKRLYRSYRKRVPVLHVGLFISRFSATMAHRFFTAYERKIGYKIK
ncbi:glycosyltransferase [Chitinophaga silvatica]|uniref:Glycosyltransferase n=1 Tax=Chitinophaga silvatica TaxID=2282649 RepID=A0A3E1YGX1_9BACT|nr:glycosyltransferase family 2 protein [Chitinophaga silvatica]RFS26641.1 glycosyltransferase [Chitinophaga silvatica]